MKGFFEKRIMYMLPLVVFVGFLACKPSKNTFTSPPGYELNEPEKFNMPESLLEISGIAFYKDKSDTIYSVQDEDGKLFRQAWANKKQKNVRFAKKGDYEDVAILNETAMVLESDGTVHAFPFSAATQEKIIDAKVFKGLVPKGEYESLYANNQTNQVYLLCKNCKDDKKDKTMSGYIFTYDPEQNTLISSGSFAMDLAGMIKKEEILKTGLKASALTRNQHTGEWFILSSVNKVLIVASPDWKVKSVHRLNSSSFNQPEGLAFDSQMNLYISNEGDELISGNILKFVNTAR